MVMMRISQDDDRRRISELEASNQSLGHQASELRVNSQDQAAQYESKVSHECWLKLLTTTLFSVGGQGPGDPLPPAAD